jgi:hypothetical protein
MTDRYINQPGFEIPENTIGYYTYQRPDEKDCADPNHNHSNVKNFKIEDVVEPLIGKPTRDWFHYAYSFCLPLTIANQYGFVVKAAHDMTLYWTGEHALATIESEGFYKGETSVQSYNNNFGAGVITIENHFVMRTPPGINLMTMPVPNYYIEGIMPLFGVVETDNLRRTFTFNIKITTPYKRIYIKKGDWLSAFIPIPRYFVENFELKDVTNMYPEDVIENERSDMEKLLWERYNRMEIGGDMGKPNDSGRRYFRGEFPDGTPFPDHQKRIK